MERRRNSRVRVTSSDTQQGLSVVAPSIVNTQSKAARNAAALSSALGFSGQVIDAVTQRRQQADRDAGTLAVQQGDVTEESLAAMEKSAAFVLGAEQTIAKQRVIQDAAAATEFYQTEFDKNKSVGELQVSLSDFWKKRYENISPSLAREIAPLMTETSSNILRAHAVFQGQQTQNQLVDANSDILRDALDKGITPDIWQNIRTNGSSQLGKDAMNTLAVKAIDQFAQDNLDETIWDRPEFKMLRENPRFREGVAKSISDARTGRIAAAESATIAAQGKALAQIDQFAEAGHPTTPELIAAASKANKDGVVLLENEAQVRAVWNKYYNSLEDQQVGSVNASLWRMGNSRAIENDTDRDAAFAADTAKFVEDNGDNPELVRGYQIDRSVKNNYLPSQIKSEIEISPQNPEAFVNAVALFDQFNTQDPTFIGRNIDSDVSRDILEFKKLRVRFGDDQQALDALRNEDRSLIKQVPQKQLGAAEEAVFEELEDGPGFTGVFDSPRLRGMIKEDLEFNINRGQTVEQATASAISNLDPSTGRYVEVEGHLYRNNEGWNTSNMREAAEAAKEAFAQERGLLGFFSGSPKASKVIMSPVPNKPGFIRLAPAGELALLGSMTEMSIAEVQQGFTRQLEARAVQADIEADADATARAKDELYPIRNIPPNDPQRAFLERRKEEVWNALSPEQQELLRERTRN